MKFITIVLLSIFYVTSASGQIMESQKPMSQGEKNALTITLPKAEEKVVCKEFEKFMKDRKAKVKGIKKSDEMFADNAKLESISNNTVDVYSLATQKGDNTELSVWFDLGGGYINSGDYPEKYNEAKKLMDEFSGRVYQIYISEMLDMEEDKLKDLEGNLKDINKDQENSEEDIEKYLQKIEEEKANIEEAKINRIQTQKEIEAQKAKVGDVKAKMKN